MVRFVDVHGTLRADPPNVPLDRGGTLSLEYDGKAPPMLFVPDDRIFGGMLFMMKEGERWHLELTVLRDAPVMEIPYALYAPDRNEIAEGESPPRMTVKDPGL